VTTALQAELLARAGIVAGVLHEHFQVRLFKRVIVVARKGRLHFADLLADDGLVARKAVLARFLVGHD